MSAAVSCRFRICGVTPVSSATVRSSIATAVRVNAASVSFAAPKSKNGLGPAFLPSTDRDERGHRAQRVTGEVRALADVGGYRRLLHFDRGIAEALSAAQETAE